MVCLSLAAEKAGRAALDYELVTERLRADLKTPECVILVGFILEFIMGFYLHLCEVNAWLGLDSELSAPDLLP